MRLLFAFGLSLTFFLGDAFAGREHDEWSEESVFGDGFEEPVFHTEHRRVPRVNPRSRVFVVVRKSDQRLFLWVKGRYMKSWEISTGAEEEMCPKRGRCYFADTPNGTFRPFRMHWKYVSKLWGGRMDRSIFFNGGIALHATFDTEDLGYKASGGCVRQTYENATYLYNLIRRYGMRNTLVKVID